MKLLGVLFWIIMACLFFSFVIDQTLTAFNDAETTYLWETKLNAVLTVFMLLGWIVCSIVASFIIDDIRNKEKYIE